MGLSSQCISCGRFHQFSDGSNISCMKFRHFLRLIAFQYIQFIQLFFGIFLHIVENIVILDNPGAHFDHGILAQKRVHDGLKYVSRFCFAKIIIGFKNLVGLLVQTVAASLIGAWEITYNIIQQICHTHQVHRRPHTYRHHGTLLHVGSKSCRNLCNRKFVTLQIPVQKFFAGLSHRFNQHFTVFIQVFLKMFGHRAFFFLSFFNISSARFLHHIHISHKFSAFTDGEMKGCDPLAVQFCQLLHHIAVAHVIHVHLCDKDNPGQFIFFTHFPGFLCSHLHA